MVRPATFDDIPAMVGMGRSMHAESSFRTIPFDDAKLASVIAALLTGKECVLVAQRDGALVGFFLGVVNEYYFSQEKLASDLALFVQPEHRGGMAGAALVRAFIAWAKERGIRHLEIGISTGVLVEQTSALLERLGFKRQGIKMQAQIE